MRLPLWRGPKPGSCRWWETASAVRRAYDLATASARVAYMGGATSRQGDLARSVGYEWTPEGGETMYLRQKVLIDVRAAGVPNPLSGLWGIVDDLDGLARLAAQTRQLGYEGMLAIHPSHIPIINQVFSPTPAEIDGWRRLIAATEDAEAPGHRRLPPRRPPHRPRPSPNRPATAIPRRQIRPRIAKPLIRLPQQHKPPDGVLQNGYGSDHFRRHNHQHQRRPSRRRISGTRFHTYRWEPCPSHAGRPGRPERGAQHLPQHRHRGVRQQRAGLQ